jgi:hypothetical protein
MRPRRPRLQIGLLILSASLFFVGCPGPRFSTVNANSDTVSYSDSFSYSYSIAGDIRPLFSQRGGEAVQRI